VNGTHLLKASTGTVSTASRLGAIEVDFCRFQNCSQSFNTPFQAAPNGAASFNMKRVTARPEDLGMGLRPNRRNHGCYQQTAIMSNSDALRTLQLALESQIVQEKK